MCEKWVSLMLVREKRGEVPTIQGLTNWFEMWLPTGQP